MNGTELKTALKRANMTQGELAARLDRSRSMVADWIRVDEVPADWLPLVREVLGFEPEAELEVENVLARFSTVDLLLELLHRERGNGGR